GRPHTLSDGDGRRRAVRPRNGTAAGVRLFFFNDTATPEIYTLSLHDALPIFAAGPAQGPARTVPRRRPAVARRRRSEEHTSELQSHHELVCRLLLEKKKK